MSWPPGVTAHEGRAAHADPRRSDRGVRAGARARAARADRGDQDGRGDQLDDLAQRNRPVPSDRLRGLPGRTGPPGPAAGERRVAGPDGGATRDPARLHGRRRRRRAPGRMAAMSIVDAHHHVWDLAVRDQPWIAGPPMAAIRRSFRVDNLRPSAHAAGVAATVLVQTVTVAAETPEMLAIAAADPLVAGGGGWADLARPGVSDELAQLAASPGGCHLVGIRHQVQSEPDRDWLRRPDVIRGLRAVAAAGLCYDLVVLPHQLCAPHYAAT